MLCISFYTTQFDIHVKKKTGCSIGKILYFTVSHGDDTVGQSIRLAYGRLGVRISKATDISC